MTIRDEIVYMYLVGSHNGQNGTTYYALEYKGHVKEFFVPDALERTLNRCMLRTIATALEGLKRPCHLIVYTKGSIGGKKLHDTYRTWTNRDVGMLILETATDRGHTVEIRHALPGTVQHDKLLYLDNNHKARKRNPYN